MILARGIIDGFEVEGIFESVEAARLAGYEIAEAQERETAEKESDVNVEQIKQVAELAHEINRAYCASLGDWSYSPWEKAPDWQKKSAINGVKFLNDNPSSTPRDCHDNWMRDKRADGWKYGPFLNPDSKEHPCIKPYDELPDGQRRKDALFIRVVRACCNFADGIGAADAN